MDFIDLKTQQSRIRSSLEGRIATVLDHGQYVMGPEVAELEAALSQFVGTRHVIGVSSGTDSLSIALMALGIGPGDEVITVPYTWISTAEVVSLVGAKPVFVDIEPDTWNMDPEKLSDVITEKTKAIIPVGIYGQPANLSAINSIAAANGSIPVIEDAAQCFGGTHRGRNSCALSSVGSTSFFPSKPLGAYGEAGALFTEDGELAERMRWIRVHGQERKHHHPIVGMNGRLDTLQAAILLSKLELYPEEIELRQKIADRYTEMLAGVTGVQCPSIAEENTSVYAQYTLLCEDREKVASALREKEIPSVSYYSVPLHLQPVFDGLGYAEGDFPVTEMVAGKCLSLPMSPYLTTADQDQVAEAIRLA